MSLRDDLKAYVDGELPPMRMAEIRDAIERDPELAAEVRELEAIGRTLRAEAWQPTAAGLDETLRSLQRKRSAPRWPWLAIPLTAGLALFMFNRPMPTQESPSMVVAVNQPSEARSSVAESFSVPKASEATAAAQSAPLENTARSAAKRAVDADFKRRPVDQGPAGVAERQPDANRRRAATPSSAKPAAASVKAPARVVGPEPNAPKPQEKIEAAPSTVPTTTALADEKPNLDSSKLTEVVADKNRVELEFADLEEGRRRIEETIAQYADREVAATMKESGARDSTARDGDARQARFVVRVPEAQAEQALAALRALALEPSKPKHSPPAGASGFRGGFGGGEERKPSLLRESPKARSERVKMRTIEIVLRPKPEAGGTLPE